MAYAAATSRQVLQRQSRQVAKPVGEDCGEATPYCLLMNTLINMYVCYRLANGDDIAFCFKLPYSSGEATWIRCLEGHEERDVGLCECACAGGCLGFWFPPFVYRSSNAICQFPMFLVDATISASAIGTFSNFNVSTHLQIVYKNISLPDRRREPPRTQPRREDSHRRSMP